MPKAKPSRVLIVLAFAAIYAIWGSTYLGIRLAIETLPPFLMAATRFMTAGAILFAWAVFNGQSIRPSLGEWPRAFIIGGLLLLCGNGGVTWAEKYIASGSKMMFAAAIIVGSVVLITTFGREHSATAPDLHDSDCPTHPCA